MKYIYHCIIPFLVLCVDPHAQQIISNSLVETENQKNPDIVKINQLWTDYLMSSPDSLYNLTCDRLLMLPGTITGPIVVQQ